MTLFQSLSLHKKILFSNLLASFIFLSVLTLTIYYSNEHLESKLLNIQVSSELDNIKTKLNENKHLKLPRTAHLSVYLESRRKQDPLPNFIKHLEVGLHHEIENNDLSYQISIEQFGNDKIYILYDITAIEDSDNQLSIIIFTAWLLLLVIMVLLSHRLSSSISKPIQQLSDNVSSINPDQRGVQIKSNFKHAEINHIAQTFNRYLDKMDDYVTKQIAFSAMASHELRSPLTVIQTSADLINCQHDDPLTQEHVDKISRSTNNMAQLIHALLHVTRDSQAEFEKKPLPIHALVEQLADNYQAEAKTKQCQIINHIAKEVRVLGDEVLLNVVLSNIIKNAIKFTSKSNIDVKFEHNTLEIIDAGKGIKEEDIEHVFNFKFKANNSQGFGIGLYISKLICDQQHWALDIVKNTQHGITVKINFPS